MNNYDNLEQFKVFENVRSEVTFYYHKYAYD